MIADIRADQNGHTPKFVYIMSQAYFNMDKIGTAQRPYKNFTTQDEMFDVIVAQARKVLDQTDVEQIIPTGRCCRTCAPRRSTTTWTSRATAITWITA